MIALGAAIQWLGLPILVVLLTARCAYRLGRLLLRSFVFESDWERLAFSTAAGLGAIGWLMLWIGVGGGIYRAPLGILILWGALGDILRWRRPRRRAGDLVFLMGAVAVFAILASPALYPPIDADEVACHLAFVKTFRLLHRVVPVPALRYPVLPLFDHMLMTLEFVMGGELAARLYHSILLALTSLALMAWGTRRFSWPVGALAAAAFCGNPIVVYLAWTAHMDLAQAMYVTLGLYAIDVSNRAEGSKWIVAAGAFTGLAASCKFSALFFMLPCMIAILYGCLQRGLGLKSLWPVLQYLLATTLIVGPFYGYIAYHSGNPFFPALGNYFGYSYFSREDVLQQTMQLQSSGWGRDLIHLIRLPWNLYFRRDAFVPEATLSPFHLVAMPFTLLAMRDRRIRALLYFVASYVLLWFYTAQFVRYLTPVIPVAALAGAAALLTPLERAPRAWAWLRRQWIVAILCAVSILPSVLYVREFSLAHGAIPTGLASRQQYLSRWMEGYPLLQRLNQATGGAYTLYDFTGGRAYFAAGYYWGDWFGQARYALLLDAILPNHWCRARYWDPLMQQFKSLGVSHFIMTKSFMVRLPRCPWFDQHFVLGDQDDKRLLLRIRYE